MSNQRYSEDGEARQRFLSSPSIPSRHKNKPTPQKWVQCTDCKKWRRVPYHLKDSELSDRWQCTDNIWDPYYASCTVSQALPDEQIDAILDCQEVEEPNDVHAVDFQSTERPQRSKLEGIRREGGVRVMGDIESFKTGQELSDVAEAMLRLGENADNLSSGSLQGTKGPVRLVPGRLIWGKVEGHDWWPAKVVRRRSVPVEVGPPPGGAAEVMYYTPVVFYTPTGIPREVELDMDSEEFPIVVCQRACGQIDEDEAEYAWLSADNIRVFCHGDTNGKKDGSQVEDEQLQKCILAAQNDLLLSEAQTQSWKDEEDSDGGWCCAAEFNRNRHQKHKKTHRRKSKRLCEDEGASDIESGPEEGPELMPYGSFRLAPKIAVEHIYAWRRPLTREDKAKELEKENEENAVHLKKLAFMEETLKQHRPLTLSLFDDFSIPTGTPELPSLGPNPSLDDLDLVQQEREAVSTLLGLGPLSQIDGETILPSLDEVEYFVKYANRSHLHNEWVDESTLMVFAKRKLMQFKRRYSDEPINMFNREWARPERIISRRKCRTGPGWELFIKWCDLGYEFCTWEAENSRILNTPETVLLYIDLWKRQINAMNKGNKQSHDLFRETKKNQLADHRRIVETPNWLKGDRLHPHQMEFLNWLRWRWVTGKGGFSSGDVGLGRTAVIAAFLQCLKQEMKCVHPMLVVVPACRLSKWDGEIDFWSEGEIRTVQFQGPAAARPVCLEHEIWQSMECMDGRYPSRETGKIPKPDVVLVSSEILQTEIANLVEVPWDVAILDTRYVPKGNAARLATSLAQIQCPHYVVADDPPTSEIGLMNALHLVNQNSASLTQESNVEMDRDERSAIQVQNLVKIHGFEMGLPLRPFPEQVYKEILIPLPFKPNQREQYKESLVKYYDFLIDEGLHRYSVHNAGTLKHIAEELSLICLHPILADDNEEFDRIDLLHLIGQSGKFEALDIMLSELNEQTTKTLVLTQSQKTLALVAKFVKERFGVSSVECIFPVDASAKQHAAMRRFRSGAATFLLATGESCGVGMQLESIDCVVIFESATKSDDDLLALSRAYQIGQTNELPVFRFFLSGTVEERMIQLIRKSDSPLLSCLSKGSGHDMKVFEDVLICGTQGLFQNERDLHGSPFFESPGQKTRPCAFTKTFCKTLLQRMRLESSDARKGEFGEDLGSIQWNLKSKNELGQDHETAELVGMVRQSTDPIIIASYWEGLLRQEWIERRKREDALHRVKRLSGPKGCYDMMDYEIEIQETHLGEPNHSMKRKTLRTKRMTHDHELTSASKGQKKQKSVGSKMDASLLESSSNDENKWTREALLSSKAHQDVLSQILADPNTVEGRATQEAFLRIDAFAKELALPTNIVMMAKQVTEILLTMKDGQESGSYFHDYTLLVVLAFASYLCGFRIGDGCGLRTLAARYKQDLETMEKLFTYVTKMMLEYKQMLIKINQVLRQKETDEEKTESEGVAEPAQTLHKELDVFLKSVSETLKKDKEADVEKLASEIMDQPPGAPIQGHAPTRWFPLATTESSPLAKQARMYDAEMFVIEKLHETKYKTIERVFHTFQERVRDHGVKALEKVNYDTMMAKNEVENKKQRLKQSIRTVMQPTESTTMGYNALLARMKQTGVRQRPDIDPMPSANRSAAFLQRPAGSGNEGNWGMYIGAQSRPSQPMDSLWMMNAHPKSNSSIHKGLLSSDRKGMPRPPRSLPALQPQQHSLHQSQSLTSRAAHPSFKIPNAKFPRTSIEETSLILKNPRMQSTHFRRPSQHSVLVPSESTLQPTSTPIQIPTSFGVISNLLPNCVYPRPHPNLLGNVHSVTETLPLVSPIRPVMSMETVSLAHGRAKPPTLHEIRPVHLEPTQTARVVLSNPAITIPFTEASAVLPNRSRSMVCSEVAKSPMERASSVPEASALALGKMTLPSVTRHGSATPACLRAAFTGSITEWMSTMLPETQKQDVPHVSFVSETPNLIRPWPIESVSSAEPVLHSPFQSVAQEMPFSFPPSAASLSLPLETLSSSKEDPFSKAPESEGLILSNESLPNVQIPIHGSHGTPSSQQKE